MSGADDDDLPTAAEGPGARAARTFFEDREDPNAVTTVDGDSQAGMVDARPRQLLPTSFEQRYQVRRRLGRGGMGDVHLCFDTRIGRDVAVKVMVEDAARHPTWRRRFLREAHVQAQLEHPGVVPVYDIGVTPDGETYFAMTRVQGITLSALLRGLRAGDESLHARYPRAARLSILARVCETIAYAHSRGVVHRDLKPPNIMLGEFGEVSVLDWGLAKLSTESDVSGSESDADPEMEFTKPGSVVGSAGYMPPEQATGDTVGKPSDVYALGAMLYEMVTLRPLHEGDRSARLRSTLRGADARVTELCDDVDPALDAICVKATSVFSDERYPDAGALLDDLRGFLAGQRASELRREVADQHVAAARLSLAAPKATETVRVAALRELGAAALLTPDDPEMIQMIEELLDPGDTLPEPAAIELDTQRSAAASQAAGRSAMAYLAALIVMPNLWWMGLRSHLAFAALGLSLIGSSLGAWLMWYTGHARGLSAYVAVPCAFLPVALMSTLFGPHFIVPTFAVMVSVAFTVSVRASKPLRRWVMLWAIASVIGPVVLTWIGILPPTLSFSGGRIAVEPWLANFAELPTVVLLLVTSMFAIIASNVLVGRAVAALRAAERRQMVLSHRLRALLPKAASS